VGLNYAFEFVAPRSGVDALLEALAERVGGAYARNLRSVLPWAPQQSGSADAGIRGLRTMFDIPNHYDLVVMVPIDDEVKRYFAGREAKIADHSDRGKAGVGLVYMSLYAGLEFVVLSLRAATTSMSTMLACSGEARKVMTSLAQAGQARALFLDDEHDDAWDLLMPLPAQSHWRHRVPRPPYGRHARPAELDAFCVQALALAGVR
jgi:hypothetical protein